MTLPLERLVYESTATGATDSLLNLSAILAQSQRNNDRDGLTGALAAHRNRFIQVVEGQAPALNALLARLGSDPRHKAITVLDRSPIETRMFGQWAMASARISPELEPTLEALMAEEQASAARIARTLHNALSDEPAAA